MSIFRLDMSDEDDLQTGIESDEDEFGVPIDEENFDEVKTDEDIFYEKTELTPEQKKLVEQKYNIEQLFDLVTFPNHFVICGPSGSGKSECCNYILSLVKHHFNHIFVFSGTYDTYQYENFTKKEQHYPVNMALIKKHLQNIIERRRQGATSKHLIIFDDFAGDMTTRYEKEINSIITKCRHENVSIFFISHWLSDLSRTCLENAKFFIVFNSSQKALDLVQPFTKLTNRQLYDRYTANSNQKFSFMFLQRIDPYKKQIYFCNPIDRLIKKNSDNIENEDF